MRDPEPVEQVRAVALPREAHVRRDGQVREQPVVLGEVPDPAALSAQVNLSGGVEPRFATEHDPPRGGAVQPGDCAQQRGLPGSGRTDQRDRLGTDGQVRAEIEVSPREGDVDVEEFHERVRSLEVSRIAALPPISRTPIEIA